MTLLVIVLSAWLLVAVWYCFYLDKQWGKALAHWEEALDMLEKELDRQ